MGHSPRTPQLPCWGWVGTDSHRPGQMYSGLDTLVSSPIRPSTHGECYYGLMLQHPAILYAGHFYIIFILSQGCAPLIRAAPNNRRVFFNTRDSTQFFQSDITCVCTVEYFMYILCVFTNLDYHYNMDIYLEPKINK